MRSIRPSTIGCFEDSASVLVLKAPIDPVQSAAVHLSLTSCNVKVSQKALFPRKLPAELKAFDWFPN